MMISVMTDEGTDKGGAYGGPMKSALEIALEKTRDIKAEETEYIPEELKAKAREVNKEYDAKIAEVETLFKSRLKEMIEQYGPQEVKGHMESFSSQLRREKDRINEDRRNAVDRILGTKK